MWVFRGTLLAFWLVGFGTLAMLYLEVFRPLASNTSVDVRTLAAFTLHSVAWWLAVIACTAFSFRLSYGWKGPLSLWVFVGVTDLIPAGVLVLFVAILAKMHSALQNSR